MPLLSGEKPISLLRECAYAVERRVSRIEGWGAMAADIVAQPFGHSAEQRARLHGGTAMNSQLRRVVILDGDAARARGLAQMLEDEGFDARATADPEEFIGWTVTWLPALVFVDIVATSYVPLEVLARLADARSRAGVVLMSGMDRGGIRAAREFGAANGLVHAGILRKPFNKGHVLMALARSPHALESVERVADPLEGWTDAQFYEALTHAVAGNEFKIVFQPKISVSTGRTVGFESLARWDHPTLGYIPPGTFIPHAATLGLMRPVTQAVTAHALAWFGGERPFTSERIAINFTAAELKDPAQLKQLRDDCERFYVAPERVALEVTHTDALADDPQARAALNGLQSDGFHLVIDDFGTGYSTAARLAALPFSEVKIDTRFVRKCVLSDSASSLVESMISTARDLDLECTAEGVENQQILDKLAGFGCDYAQGYYIARPLPARELETWLETS